MSAKHDSHLKFVSPAKGDKTEDHPEDCPEDYQDSPNKTGALVSVGGTEKLIDLQVIPIPKGATGTQQAILAARIPCIYMLLYGGFQEATISARFVLLP